MNPPADPSELLQNIYLAGFELQTFDRYPRAIGVIRGDCIALLEPGSGGFKILGAPGWKIGDAIGVLTSKDGRQVFQSKSEIIEATSERVALVQKFREDLEGLLLAWQVN